jgi:protein tyrosine phosphatase (PTP) superfamily phosphohydrolase (DUF442 family)
MSLNISVFLISILCNIHLNKYLFAILQLIIEGIKMKNILNYIKVNKNISTSGLLNKKDIKEIAKRGFDVVINLSVDDDRSLAHESKIVAKNGMVYIHIPISWTNPQADRMNLFFHILDGFLNQDKKVFIHCMKNYRVAVFIYRYKKDVLKEKNAKLIAPADYKPTKVWRKLLKK